MNNRVMNICNSYTLLPLSHFPLFLHCIIGTPLEMASIPDFEWTDRMVNQVKDSVALGLVYSFIEVKTAGVP